MKKVAIGCLIILGILVVGGGGLAIWGWGKISDMVGEFTEFTSEMQEVHQATPRDRNFQPPEDGLLTERQVSQLVAVESNIHQTMSVLIERHEERYSQLKALMEEDGRDPNLGELLQGGRDVAAILRGYKTSQVEALQQQNLSLEEYSWMRATAVRNLSQVSDEISEEHIDALRDAEIHPENIEKLREHVDLLKETLPWMMLDAFILSFIND